MCYANFFLVSFSFFLFLEFFFFFFLSYFFGFLTACLAVYLRVCFFVYPSSFFISLSFAYKNILVKRRIQGGEGFQGLLYAYICESNVVTNRKKWALNSSASLCACMFQCVFVWLYFFLFVVVCLIVYLFLRQRD